MTMHTVRSTEIDTVRAFNRRYTPRIGALDESYLGTGLPLGPSRLVFELGERPRPLVELRGHLGLDSGYLSRMLRQLEADDLVVVERDPADGRRRTARLTSRGQRRRRALDQRSEQVAAELLDPLTPGQRRRLTEALATAARILGASTCRPELVDIASPEAQECIRRYGEELDRRLPSGFDPSAGGAGDRLRLVPPGGAFLVLRTTDGEIVGCGGVQRHSPTSGEIKRLWVAPAFRGEGLGRRLLDELEALARSLGYRRVVLDTAGELHEAIALYRRAGYRVVKPYNDNTKAALWFAKSVGPRRTDRGRDDAPGR